MSTAGTTHMHACTHYSLVVDITAGGVGKWCVLDAPLVLLVWKAMAIDQSESVTTASTTVSLTGIHV